MSDFAGSCWIHSHDRHVMKFYLESPVKIAGEMNISQQLCVFLIVPFIGTCNRVALIYGLTL